MRRGRRIIARLGLDIGLVIWRRWRSCWGLIVWWFVEVRFLALAKHGRGSREQRRLSNAMDCQLVLLLRTISELPTNRQWVSPKPVYSRSKVACGANL